jgi:hypothetical protein
MPAAVFLAVLYDQRKRFGNGRQWAKEFADFLPPIERAAGFEKRYNDRDVQSLYLPRRFIHRAAELAAFDSSAWSDAIFPITRVSSASKAPNQFGRYSQWRKKSASAS